MSTWKGYKNWIKRVNIVTDITGYSTMELLTKADGDAGRATDWVCRIIEETDKTNEYSELVMIVPPDELMYRFLLCQQLATRQKCQKQN
jgi:hypothetical protein